MKEDSAVPEAQRIVEICGSARIVMQNNVRIIRLMVAEAQKIVAFASVDRHEAGAVRISRQRGLCALRCCVRRADA